MNLIHTRFIIITLLLHFCYHAPTQTAALQTNALQEPLIHHTLDIPSSETLNQQLAYAIFTSNVAQVQQALEKGANPNVIYKRKNIYTNDLTHCLLSYSNGYRQLDIAGAGAFLSGAL